jgi:dynein heavy chain
MPPSVGAVASHGNGAAGEEEAFGMSDTGGAIMPSGVKTVFDWNVDVSSLEWSMWEQPQWSFPEAGRVGSAVDSSTGVVGAWDISHILLPTMDSARAVSLLHMLVSPHGKKTHQPVLLVGAEGTAKTATASMFFRGLDHDVVSSKRLNFSSATTPARLQGMVESELERRGGKNFGPPGGKHLALFLDDMSMPELNHWGDQPTLEWVRQLIEDRNFAYLERDKRGDFKSIEDLYFVGAMAHPGSGKNDVPARIKRHFFVLNMPTPTSEVVESIYGRLLSGRFSPEAGVSADLAAAAERLTSATVSAWLWAKKHFMPTPAKFHYQFTLRDLGRVFSGVCRAPAAAVASPKQLLQLWRHECDRVFADKLVDVSEKDRWI